MMKKYLFLVIGVTGITVGASAKDIHSIQAFFEKHCVQCHGEDKQKGKVRLDDLSAIDESVWGEVFDQLASEEMPPDDEPQPSEEERREVMDFVLAYAQGDPGAHLTGLRRLNKREYQNTVRDLLGLEDGIFDPAGTIYEDEISEGFDTAAEELVISNELLLEYLDAAKRSLDLALFSKDTSRPKPRVINVDTRRMKGSSRRYVTFTKNHVTLRAGGKDKVYDGQSSRVMTVPGRYKITVTASGIDRNFYGVPLTPESGPLKMGIGIIGVSSENITNKDRVLKTFQLKDDEEQTFEFETWIDKNHYPFLSFVNGSSKPITQIRSNIRRRKIPASAMKQPYRGPGIRISQFRIEGPFHDEWPPRTLRATYDSNEIPDLNDEKAREAAVLRFANRAFRQPVKKEDIRRYLNYLNEQYAATKDWHESVIRTFAAMMSSVDFLYIRDPDAKSDKQLSPYALANRLSYFLWSTMPDAELSALSKSGEILQPAILRKQVERLLADEKALRFSHSFTDQWLSLDTLGSMPPDIKGDYRIYYRANLEPAMKEETRRFFHYILQENRSVRDFLDSDYTFLNRGLANLYGVPYTGGGGFTRVSLPKNSIRGGLLGHGSVLTLTSNGVETIPVVRGHWVLDELLGTPPPPAPKEVPAIVPDLNGVDTVRELLEKHRSDPSCIECHRQMDPLGMALEAFDPIGQYRTKYSKTQRVTTYGTYLGQDFKNVSDLKKILVTQLRPFSRSLVIKLAEYAKGRKLMLTDQKLVEAVLDQIAEDNYRLNDLVVAIATGELMTQP